VYFGWMHPFFLFLPTFLIAAVAYIALAWAFGAARQVPDEVRRDIDAVEARIAELAEEEAEAQAPRHNGAPGQRRRLPVFGFLAAAMIAALALTAVFAPERFSALSVVFTAAYFAFSVAANLKRRQGME